MIAQDSLIADIRNALDAHGAAIRRELILIDNAYDGQSVNRARVALTFAMMSPRCPFRHNVAVTMPLVAAIMRGASAPDIETIIRGHGIGMAPTKARAMFAASPYIRDMGYPPERDMLVALRGAGLKVASMALALYDPWAPVITIDTHMVAGLDITTNAKRIRPRDYLDAERAVLDTANEHFPLVPYFAIQWALWSHYSGAGFQSHLPIFGL